MSPFLDLVGASGAAYRFRRVADPAALPATAGNFVLAAPDGGGVICCGVADSLLNAAYAWREAEQSTAGCGLYVRLNVSRAQRDREHEDIVEALRPLRVISAERLSAA